MSSGKHIWSEQSFTEKFKYILMMFNEVHIIMKSTLTLQPTSRKLMPQKLWALSEEIRIKVKRLLELN